ncbi:MAG: bifunctional riboflavin kinase/FMN adenylyltransferase [Hydrogenothermus sp.]|nr:MAG: bifunctional riboflavin kinase/FMN adenylyltransferase [Hydrogenothermus sp.]
MRTISIKDIPLKENTACSIGNFDGFHEGHLKVLETLKKEAKKRNLKTVVISFNPHPREVFTGETLCKITNLETKKEFLKKLGIDYFLVISFTKEFAKKTPDEFIDFLKNNLNCKLVVVGQDWKFGKDKKGDINYLKNFIEVIPVQKVLLNKDKLGSSVLRKLLKEGNIEKINQLINRIYCLKGKIVKGQGLGKELGFPTINVDPQENLCLKYGVYAGFIEINGKVYKSAINFGIKPTFEGKNPLIEAHIIQNFNEEINQYFAKVYFIKYIREEKKFESVKKLKNQILMDVKKIEEILNEENYKFSGSF